MGCNVHIHAEAKINGTWHHYGSYYPGQTYGAFALLAGVRQGKDPVVPISEPRGLPEDATTMTLFCHSNMAVDAHTESWLGLEELDRLHDYLTDDKNRWYDMDNWLAGSLPTDGDRSSVYLFRNGWDLRDSELPKGVEAVRLVFWFDN